MRRDVGGWLCSRARNVGGRLGGRARSCSRRARRRIERRRWSIRGRGRRAGRRIGRRRFHRWLGGHVRFGGAFATDDGQAGENGRKGFTVETRTHAPSYASRAPVGFFRGAQPVLDISDGETKIPPVKLSSKGRYAIRALFHIAYFSDGGATQVRDIAERQGIPPRFLEQIFQDLKRAGLVASKRGPHGGYSLTRPLEEISLGDAVRALEGPVQLSDPSSSAGRAAAADCLRATEAVFEDLSSRMQTCLDDVSLADVCSKARQLGVARPNQHRHNYVI